MKMYVNKHNYFYLKRENRPEHIYNAGSEYWFLSYFKDDMYVLDGENNEITAPHDTLYIVPPHTRMYYKSVSGGPFVHTLFMFKADKEYMDKLRLPYKTPIQIKNTGRLEELMFNAEKCDISASDFKQDGIDAYLTLILIFIHDNIHSIGEDYRCESGEDLQLVRLNVMNSPGVLWTVEDMARLANMSVSGFQRKYKKLYGKSPIADLYDFRFTKAKRLINSGYSNTYILNSCGFKSLQHFSRFFKERAGMSPSEYRKRNNLKEAEVSD